MNSIKAAVASAATLVLTACGGGGGGSRDTGNNGGNNGPQSFSVGGSVAGLSGAGLTLTSNGQTLAVGANGSFTFGSTLAGGTAYNVTVATQPNTPTQTCTVVNGSGTLSANVANVTVTCVTSTFTLGGTVSGLAGSGLTLSSNGQSLAVSSNGTFVFPAPLASGTAYQLAIATQPESPAQDCGVSNGSGTLTTGNITSIAVTCGSPSPLTVTGTLPVADALDVTRDNTLMVDFSATLNAATVTPSTVTLSNSIAGSQEIDVSSAGSRITVTPRRKLLPAAPYTLTIGTGVRSSRGTGMTAPATLNFTTREGTWQASTSIEDTAARIGNPEIAANGNTVVAVWMEVDVGVGLSQYLPASGWAGRQGFASGPNSNNPQVVVDSQGRSHIAWTRFQNLATSIEGMQYSTASGFTPVHLVENDNAFGASSVQFAIDGQDTVFALWRYGSGTSSTDGSIWSARRVAGGEWDDIPPRLDRTPGGSDDPAIAVDPAGNAMASWTQRDLNGRTKIWASRYVNGAGWFPGVRVDNTAATANAFDSSIATNAASDAIALYRYTVTTSDDAIGASRFTVSTGWTPAVAIDVSNSRIGEAKIAMDPAGNALAVWIEGSTQKTIWANRYTVGSGWETAQRLAVATANTEGIQIATDNAGNGIAIWSQYDSAVNDSSEIMAIRYVPGRGWGTARSIDNETDDVVDPHIAFDASGNATVVWLSYDGSVNNVRATRFE